MIKEYEQFHGMALCRLAHKFREYKISSNVNDDNSSYLINDNLGIYIKYSKKRLAPWTFTFNSEHYEAINRLAKAQQQVFIIFVCGMDGICCIDYLDFCQVVSKVMVNEVKYVSVSRFKNQQYQVSGTDGEIKHKFADTDMFIKGYLQITEKTEYINKILNEGINQKIGMQEDNSIKESSGKQILNEEIHTRTYYDDANKRNTSCRHFDAKTNRCLNTESPYFILDCCGARQCKNYEIVKNGDGINSITKRFVGKSNIFTSKKTDQGISLGDKVLLYFYEGKHQQTLYIGTNNNALSVLERECLGKRNGDKMEVNNKHYVVVNYKRYIT